MSMMIVLIFVLFVIAGCGVAAYIGVTAALASRNRRELPPNQPPPTAYQGYQGPSGPVYPAYNPAQYLSADDHERVMILIRAGKKMHAIKLYREATGAGLREAKEAVEHLERFR